jgi:hypothetical protein
MRYRVKALALLGAVVAACAPARDPETATQARAAVLALQPYFRDLKTVHVTTPAGRLTMLLDTGGGATLVTPEVAGRIGCQPFGRDVGYRMSGERVEFRRCESLSVSDGMWQRLVEPVAVFDVNGLLPPELPPLDGVLALDAFRGDVITIDWPAGALTVHAGEAGQAALQQHGLPARIATGESGRFFSAFVPVAASRGRMWLLLDSGNLRGTLVDRHVVRDGLLNLTESGDAALRVGPRPAVDVRVESAELVIDGTLGTAYLLRGPVTLDLRGDAGTHPFSRAY